MQPIWDARSLNAQMRSFDGIGFKQKSTRGDGVRGKERVCGNNHIFFSWDRDIMYHVTLDASLCNWTKYSSIWRIELTKFDSSTATLSKISIALNESKIWQLSTSLSKNENGNESWIMMIQVHWEHRADRGDCGTRMTRDRMQREKIKKRKKLNAQVVFLITNPNTQTHEKLELWSNQNRSVNSWIRLPKGRTDPLGDVPYRNVTNADDYPGFLDTDWSGSPHPAGNQWQESSAWGWTYWRRMQMAANLKTLKFLSVFCEQSCTSSWLTYQGVPEKGHGLK